MWRGKTTFLSFFGGEGGRWEEIIFKLVEFYEKLSKWGGIFAF